MSNSPRARLNNVTAKNVRGPYPSGQCFQFARSDDTSLTNFYCLNEAENSWVEDTISAWRSSNVVIKHGLIDGNNANTGICLMYEGSSHETHGGLFEDIDAVHCQGCFSGYPSNGLVMRGVTCANSWCDGTFRGIKRGGKFNLFNFGNNEVDKVYTKNNIVEDSFYQDDCPYTKLLWTAKDTPDAVKKFEVTRLETFTPREPL